MGTHCLQYILNFTYWSNPYPTVRGFTSTFSKEAFAPFWSLFCTFLGFFLSPYAWALCGRLGCLVALFLLNVNNSPFAIKLLFLNYLAPCCLAHQRKLPPCLNLYPILHAEFCSIIEPSTICITLGWQKISWKPKYFLRAPNNNLERPIFVIGKIL